MAGVASAKANQHLAPSDALVLKSLRESWPILNTLYNPAIYLDDLACAWMRDNIVCVEDDDVFYIRELYVLAALFACTHDEIG